jgi:K+-transporting ATPase ATPase B chain
LVGSALKQALVMLRPDIQWKNPVMFVVEVGAVLTLLFTVAALPGYATQAPAPYLILLDVWLFLTVLFANFASALAEARGKAQADALRRARRCHLYRSRKSDLRLQRAIDPLVVPALVVEEGLVLEGSSGAP